MKERIRSIVGLGNPGPEYELTRHNLGFWVLDALNSRHGGKWEAMPGHSRHAKVTIAQQEVVLFCPLTFMNLSGRAVKDLIKWLGLTPEEIILVHDDMDLNLGRLKLVQGGGSGGHRGVSSVLECLGSKEVPRLKVGIGRPKYGEEVTDFVLSPFYPEEIGLVERVVDKAVWACELVLVEGVDKAMNRVNCLNLRVKEE